MSVDKGIFRRHRENQPETFDFHSGEFAPIRWKTDVQIDRYVPTHCCYCGVQCGMYLKVADGKVVGVEPREDFPLNHGMLCPKGATAYQTVNHPDRLLYPMMRRHGKNSPLERVSWDEALDTIVQRFHAIQSEYGKDAVASYSGSSLTNEKCYLMGKFARVALGTRHTDYNGRLCMSSATGANERSLGLDRAANPVSDMLHAECIFVIGANVGECFPIITSYLWQARDRRVYLCDWCECRRVLPHHHQLSLAGKRPRLQAYCGRSPPDTDCAHIRHFPTTALWNRLCSAQRYAARDHQRGIDR